MKADFSRLRLDLAKHDAAWLEQQGRVRLDSDANEAELARQLHARLPGSDIVTLDSYYRHRPDLTFEQRGRTNFDHPDSLDSELLHEHLTAIAEGRRFEDGYEASGREDG